MRLFFFTLIFFMLLSCSKEESNDTFIWSKSYGGGEANFIRAVSDSLIIACGHADGNPLLVSLDSEHKENFIINPEINGSFTSYIADDDGITIAGCSGTDLLLMRYDLKGGPVWEDTIRTGFNVESAKLLPVNNGLLAVATPLPDSLGTGDTGYMFVKFDTTGLVSEKLRISASGGFISAFDATTGAGGNILLALTKKQGSAKSKASVACFSPLLVKLWETDLFNNPAFASASLLITWDASGKILVGGRNEITSQDNTSDNSFIAALDQNGAALSGWSQKKYPEFSNEGRALLFNSDGNMLFLNRRCFIINELDRTDGTSQGIIRPFISCNSGNTDALAASFDLVPGREYVYAGSLGKSFFIAVRTLQ